MEQHRRCGSYVHREDAGGRTQPMLSPKRLFLSYPGLHIVSHAFRASLAAANRLFLAFACLQVNKSLTSLNLAANRQITDNGWAEIAKGLAVCVYCTARFVRFLCARMQQIKTSYAFFAAFELV